MAEMNIEQACEINVESINSIAQEITDRLFLNGDGQIAKGLTLDCEHGGTWRKGDTQSQIAAVLSKAFPSCSRCDYCAWTISAETGAVLYCAVCDARSRANDFATERNEARAELAQVTEERDALKVEYESRVIWIAKMNQILGYDNSDGFYSSPDPFELATALQQELATLRLAAEPLLTNRSITLLYERLTTDWQKKLDDPFDLPQLDGHQIVALVSAYRALLATEQKEGEKE